MFLKKFSAFRLLYTSIFELLIKAKEHETRTRSFVFKRIAQ